MARTMNLVAYEQRVKTARKLGTEAAERCTEKAAANDPMFRIRALEFIVAYVKKYGEVSGETATLAAVHAGIKPHDQRAFGAVYQQALREKQLRIVGSVKRVRGHGSDGGKLYAVGENAC